MLGDAGQHVGEPGLRIVERSHDRPGRTIYDWRHDLAVIQRKPGALRNGGPFAEMPEAFRKLQAQLLRRPGGDREMVDVLALVLQHDEQAVARERAAIRFLEFFAGTIRNPHTRWAYAPAVFDYLAWCQNHGVVSIANRPARPGADGAHGLQLRADWRCTSHAGGGRLRAEL